MVQSLKKKYEKREHNLYLGNEVISINSWIRNADEGKLIYFKRSDKNLSSVNLQIQQIFKINVKATLNLCFSFLCFMT